MKDKDSLLLEEAYGNIVKGITSAYRYPVDGELEAKEYKLSDGTLISIDCKWEAGLTSEGDIDESSIILSDFKVYKFDEEKDDYVDITGYFEIENEDNIVSKEYPELAKTINGFVDDDITETVSNNFGDYDIHGDMEDVAAGL